MNMNEDGLKLGKNQPQGDRALNIARFVDARTLQLSGRQGIRTYRICICCGEPMIQQRNGLSFNPNVCASCVNLADGLEEANPGELGPPDRDTNFTN